MKEPQLLQTKAYDYLIDLIKKGKLKTDKIYSLNQLAKDAGFSKIPFRDAVLRLEQERYIDILPSRGFTLHKMTKEDIIETYQIRNNNFDHRQRQPVRNNLTPICDFSRGVLNARLCARIQHLLPGHKYRGFGFLASVLWLE